MSTPGLGWCAWCGEPVTDPVITAGAVPYHEFCWKRRQAVMEAYAPAQTPSPSWGGHPDPCDYAEDVALQTLTLLHAERETRAEVQARKAAGQPWPPPETEAGALPQEPDPDDKRVRLHLARFPTPPTIEQVVALTKAITGRDPTPEERAEALRILDEPAARRQHQDEPPAA